MIQQVHHKVIKLLVFLGLVISSSILLFSQITVTSPNGGESWMLGTTVNIRWTRGMKGPEYVRIILRKGWQDIIIISPKAPNKKSYSWSIPNNLVTDSNYRIRIEGVGGTISDQSNGFFTIRPLLQKWEPTPVKVIPLPPVIERVDDPYGEEKDVLQAGEGVHIYGKNFGTQPGKILMYGNFKNSPVELENLWWENSTHVKGAIPLWDYGQPSQTVEIKVETKDGLESNPWPMNFVEQRKEEKFLTQADVDVVLCGYHADHDVCNNLSFQEDSFYFTTAETCPKEFAMCGFHENDWGDTASESGDDVYQISLKNGWKFKDMQIVEWEKSSDDEVLIHPSPPLPVGGSNWTTVIHWRVTPGDNVRYRIKILVEGPLGTHYK